MSLSTVWIKDNMLYCDQFERQLTEPELKVQKTIKNLSVPEWYLNKRSNPPKILNSIPIECRPSSWKNPNWKNTNSKNTSTQNSTSSAVTVIDVQPKLPKKPEPINSPTSNCGVTHHQMSPEESKHSNESQLKRSEKLMDTSIPVVKLERYTSKTFPKMSPSRKIQNINIVFPPRPLKLSNESGVERDENKTQISKNNIFFEERKTNDANKMTEDCETTPRKTNSPKKQTIDSLVSVKIICTPRTPSVNSTFQVRTTSTPKFTAATNLFSSTIFEETPKAKKMPSRNILEKISIFEDSWNNSMLSEKSFSNMSGRISRLDNNWNRTTLSVSYTETPETTQEILLNRNIESVDPIILETIDSPNSSFSVRDIVKKVELSMVDQDISAKRSTIEWNKSKKTSESSYGGKAELKYNPESSVTKFLTTRRKSTELENIVRSKQAPREKGIVQGIIEALAEKTSSQSSLPRQNHQVVEKRQNFVRNFVDSLEKRKTSVLNETIRYVGDEEDLGSGYESEVKSCTTTSVSPKDTDSSSDSDRRSPRQKSGDNHKNFDFDGALETNENPPQLEECCDDDSVYWIPVSRCKLPRTSSLLNMMSKLSTNTVQSPSISPIRTDSEPENSPINWGATYKGSRNLSKKLFRIDETSVLDSGYSDKSGKSVIGCSVTDSTWSEDTQNESGSEVRNNRAKRSSNRKTIIGITFQV